MCVCVCYRKEEEGSESAKNRAWKEIVCLCVWWWGGEEGKQDTHRNGILFFLLKLV